MLDQLIDFFSEDIEIFRSNVSYWMVLVTIALSYTLLLMGVASVGHILVWAMLGSYAVIAALSHYFSGNLQYIIINTFRRATVENFNQAVIDPPYQTAGELFFLGNMYLEQQICRLQT